MNRWVAVVATKPGVDRRVEQVNASGQSAARAVRIFTRPIGGKLSILMILVVVTALGCSTASASSRLPRPATAGDTSLFAAVATWAAHLEEEPNIDIRIDPRPMPAEVDTFDVEPPPIAMVDSSVIQARSRVLTRLGISETDAVKDSQCAWSRGLPPPPLPGSPPVQNTIATRCRAMDQYRAVIFSLPKAQDVNSRQQIRAVVFLNYGIDVYDLVVGRSRSGVWRVLRANQIAGERS
jgi:hypothetical protein